MLKRSEHNNKVSSLGFAALLTLLGLFGGVVITQAVSVNKYVTKEEFSKSIDELKADLKVINTQVGILNVNVATLTVRIPKQNQ